MVLSKMAFSPVSRIRRVLCLLGREYVSKSITYKPLIATDSPFSIVASNQIHEKIAYLHASEKVILLLVLRADNEAELQKSLPAFQTLLASFR